MSTASPTYRGYRYPTESITQAVRLHYRFPLSYRGVEELLFERGVVVSYETIRSWCLAFGPLIAAELKRRRPQPKGTWHLDEMFIKMKGKTHYLWRAVDADGMVLDILLQERRNQAAAEAFLRRVVEGYPQPPRVAVTAQRQGPRRRGRATAPARCGDGQAGQLRAGDQEGAARHAPSPAQGAEQSGGELPPTDAATGTGHAPVQIAGTSAALPGTVRPDSRAPLSGAPSLVGGPVSRVLQRRFATWCEVTGMAA